MMIWRSPCRCVCSGAAGSASTIFPNNPNQRHSRLRRGRDVLVYGRPRPPAASACRRIAAAIREAPSLLIVARWRGARARHLHLFQTCMPFAADLGREPNCSLLPSSAHRCGNYLRKGKLTVNAAYSDSLMPRAAQQAVLGHVVGVVEPTYAIGDRATECRCGESLLSSRDSQ
jgi:hypothetical protein